MVNKPNNCAQIIMGDFNSMINPNIDRWTCNNSMHKKPSALVNTLLQADYIDTFRLQHLISKAYMWCSSMDHNIKTKIDVM